MTEDKSTSHTLAGIHGVREALRASPERVRRVVLAQGELGQRSREILALARSHGIPVYRERPRVLDRLVRGAHHQGAVAEISPVSWWNLEDLITTAPAPALLLALDRVEDPRNLGAVVRAAEGAGVHGILVPQRGSASPSEAAVSASAGALLHARLGRVTNLAEALERVRQSGVWVVGVTPSGREPWFEFDYTVPVLLVVGSEGRGLRRRVAECCDQTVSLPQFGRVESLNVSVAAGIVLYEVVRQRLVKGQISGYGDSP